MLVNIGIGRYCTNSLREKKTKTDTTYCGQARLEQPSMELANE
jgi:hypothetical protein